MMLLPTKSTRSGVSTGGFFTAGDSACPAAPDESRASETAHKAAMIFFIQPPRKFEQPSTHDGHFQLHGADAVYRALQVVAARELRHPGGCAGRDQRSRLERRHAGQEADQVAQPVDHVRGVRAHHVLAVLLDVDVQVLRLADLVAADDPRPQPAEGIEALADVARVVAAYAPRIADADVPAHRVAVDVVEGALRGDVPRRLADHRAQLALEIH